MIEDFELIIAIDVGVNGGFVARFPDGRINIEKMPISFEEMCDMFSLYSGSKAFVECQHLRKTDVYSGRWHNIHKLCMQFQKTKDALRCADIQVIEITPQKWQKPLSLNAKNYADRKKALKEIAKDKFPDIKVTGWNQDALLIMDFIKNKQHE